jgi:hypothetical protein
MQILDGKQSMSNVKAQSSNEVQNPKYFDIKTFVIQLTFGICHLTLVGIR